MRPNVERTRDPINFDAMPSMKGMELDYRTELQPPWHNNRVTVGLLFTSSIIGCLVIVGMSFAGHLLATPLFLAIALTIGATLAATAALRGEPPIAWGTALAAGPACWLVALTSHPVFHALLNAVALFLVLHVSHTVVTHYARWLHANPYLDRSVRRAWLAAWPATTIWQYLRSLLYSPTQAPQDADADAGDAVAVREASERSHYPLAFGAVVLAYLLAVLVMFLLPSPLYRGMLATLIFVALLVAFGLYNAKQVTPAASSRPPFKTVFRGLLSYVTYNAHGTQAPGVFQSPCGSAFSRQTNVGLAVFLLALTILPMASYFPVFMLLTGTKPWIDAASNPTLWEEVRDTGVIDDVVYNLAGPRPEPQRRNQASELTAAQRAYLNELSPSQREDYLAALNTPSPPRPTAADPYGRLTAAPWAWFFIAVEHGFRRNAAFLFAAAGGIVFSLIIPPLVFFSVLFALGSRVLVHHYITLEGIDETPGLYHPSSRTSRWEAYMKRLRESRHGWRDGRKHHPSPETDHLLAGFSVENDYPILLSREILREHAHITGDTGSGKTALGITPLVAQLIGRPHTSVVIIDLKGDMALFEAARIGVEQANKILRRRKAQPEEHIDFRWFTNENDRCTHVFNPFLQKHLQGITKHQRAEILLQSLGLDYGEGYGTHYYSSINRDVLSKVLEAFDDDEINSFRRLYAAMTTDIDQVRRKGLTLTPKQREDASHLFAVIHSLTSFDALNVVNHPDSTVLNNRIDMSSLVSRPQVAYFYLPAALEASSVREIAKLALYSLLTAAVRRKQKGHQVYLFIDEFQQVVSHDLEIVLRQARSHDIAAILANQTLSDLKTQSANLIPTVQANTRFKQVFSATDLAQQEALVRASGEAMYHMAGWTDAAETYFEGYDPTVDDEGEGAFLNLREDIGPRIRPNDVIRASDNEFYSIVHVSRGKGFTQYGGFPFPMRSDYHITAIQYTKRSNAPWPEPQPGTVTPPISTGIKQKPKKKSGDARPRKHGAQPRPTQAEDPLDELASDLE